MAEAFLKLEAQEIFWLQGALQPVEAVLGYFSTLTRTASLSMYMLPIILALNVRLYMLLTLLVCIAGYANTVLKMTLMGPRPYWWVKMGGGRPSLRQTEITCETSPGNPSGHVMLNAAIWFVFVYYGVCWVRRNYPAGPFCGYTLSTLRQTGVWAPKAVWAAYFGMLLAVSVSRMYFASHFMHQCVLGGLVGWGLAHGLIAHQCGQWQERLFCYDWKKMTVLGAGAGALVLAVHFGQLAVGLDPLWATKLAFNHCQNAKFVHPETTPLYCVIRDLGMFFGLAALAPLNRRLQPQLAVMYSLPLMGLLAGSMAMLSKQVPKQYGVGAFYGSTFLLHFAMVFVSVWLVQKLACRLPAACRTCVS